MAAATAGPLWRARAAAPRPQRDAPLHGRRGQPGPHRRLLRCRIERLARVLRLCAVSRQDGPKIRFDRGEDVADVERVQPGAWVKAQRVTVLREDPIEHENVEVDVRVERAPESLHDGDRAAPPVGDPRVPRLAPQKTEDRSQGAPHDGAAEIVIPGQPIAEAVGQTQHPLPHRHPREHVVN